MIHGDMQHFALTLDKFPSHAAKWHPQSQVISAREDGGLDRIGYAELADRSRRASALLEALGVVPGDHVATLAWNTRAHVELWYAIMGIGAVCHTLNPRLTAAELADMVGQSGARILVASADLAVLAEEIAARAPRALLLMLIDGDPGDPRALEPMLASETELARWGEFAETAPSSLCFTSGTTGPPKGVTYTHRSSFLHTMRMLQADMMAISASDNVLVVVPMFHANAWGLPFAVAAAGGNLVLPGRRSDGASLAHLINEARVTIAAGVPTVWVTLLEHLEAEGADVPSLKRVIVGGAPIAPSLMERIEQRLGVVVQTSWGMTELSPSGTLMSARDPVRSAALAGRPQLGVDLLLTEADGQPLADQRNAEGHLRVRGAAVIARYFGHDEPATDADGWFPTGDLARIDDRGNLIITGRAKDLIKSGGEWINPAEIEALVGGIPEVSLAAVVARPDPKWGERPVLFVEVQGNSSTNDEYLLAPLRGRIPSWWVPDAIVRLERMPLAATGKIDKHRLRLEYCGG
ncbi:AMP-binding protein [Sphingomonas sp.]|uniref:AMP-binding protein n=1 Tax=Sphingomonas sp. TaxID=28214 RepID=UPI0025CC99BC|nr:AMP-binding protein [Sphingomonas sp.]